MNKKIEHRYLVTDSHGWVMRFIDGRFCYCYSRNFPAKHYSRSEALKLIRVDNKNTLKNNWIANDYKLLRIEV